MTEKKKDTLKQMMYELLRSHERSNVVLSRGLVVAFTPQPCDPRPGAGARLVWSRKGNHPSEVEDGIMETAVTQALHDITDRVVVAGPAVRDSLMIRQGWGSTLMTWRWADTAVLLKLKGKEKMRAEEWLENRKT